MVLMVLAGVQATPAFSQPLGGQRSSADAVETARGTRAAAHAPGRASRDTRRSPDRTPRAASTSQPPASPSPEPSSPSTASAPSSPATATAPTTAAAAAPTSTPAPEPAAPASGPAAGRALVFNDDFDTLELGPGRRWGHKTTSYEFGDHNPNNYKRDWVTPNAMQVAGGVLTMTATPRDGYYWNTGLLTTQNTHGVGGDGFRVQAGDFLVNRVMLPTGNVGAWPGLWTWDGPDGEVDAFEWHSDVPHVLEFTNHVRQGSHYYRNSDLVAAGEWVWIGVQLGRDSNTWYVGDALGGMQAVYSDGTGIGSARPYVIANLSVTDSPWHSSPSGSSPIVYKIDTVRVYR